MGPIFVVFIIFIFLAVLVCIHLSGMLINNTDCKHAEHIKHRVSVHNKDGVEIAHFIEFECKQCKSLIDIQHLESK